MTELTEFDKAFIEAYWQVNQCPRDVLIEYVNAKTDQQQDDFYKNHSEYYSHLTDTYCTFRDGFEYAKQLYMVIA